MTIDINLFDVGAAVSKLNKAKENLQTGVKDLVEILLEDGSEIAQASDGSMADISKVMQTDETGSIIAGGNQPIIAEFGAGDATLSPSGLFENMPDTPVYPGSYSELVGSGQYAENGWWMYRHKVFTKIEPRQGLYNAKSYVKDNAESIAREVIKL